MSVVVSLQSKVCSKCKEVKTLDGFSKRKASKSGYRSECKACNKEHYVKWCASNPDYHAKYYADNLEKFREYSAEYRAANPEKIKEKDAKYRVANPEKGRAKCAKRRAAKRRAIPKWLTEDDYKAMEAIYDEATKLELETGTKMHVDHIHPLQGKLVCGLHCPTNLQILTEAENCSKGNKFTPYVESDLTD